MQAFFMSADASVAFLRLPSSPEARASPSELSGPMSEPIRLAKRVAELAGCSRSEAEQYIEGGWVTVDGETVEAPQRPASDERVEIDPAAETRRRRARHAAAPQAVGAPWAVASEEAPKKGKRWISKVQRRIDSIRAMLLA